MQHVRKSTFKVLFYLKKNAPKKNGKVAIMGRITIDGKQSQFSTKLEIFPDKWDLKFGRMLGKAEEALRINQRLKEMRTRLQSLYDELMKRDGFVTSERLKNNFLGLDTAQETLLGLYDKFNQEMLKMVEKGTRVMRTYYKYRIVYNHLTRFIPKQYNRKDIPLRELTEDFINDFDTCLRIEVGIVHNTVWTYMLPLKKVVAMAVDKELIYKNPFRHYHITEEESDRGYLLKEEVEKLIAYEPKGRCLTLTRDLFVFSCLTGFAFIDIQNLRKSHLQSFFDGNLWLSKRRQKTDTLSNVRLIDATLNIIKKYEGKGKEDFLFPKICNACCNKHIKTIMADCGIVKHKPISFHWARHTFGTLFLTEGIPLESVSKMMGHKDLRTTQIYAKITNESVSRDMDMVVHKFDRFTEMTENL
jgi:integrase